MHNKVIALLKQNVLNGENMEIVLTETKAQEGNLILVLKSNVLPESLKKFDKDGKLAKVIEIQKFTSKSGEVLHIPNYEHYDNIWLVGQHECENAIKIGSTIARLLQGKSIDSVCLWVEDESKLSDIISGLLLRNYCYDAYKKQSESSKISVEKVFLVGNISHEEISRLQFEAESVKRVRSLINCPPNEIYPATLAKAINEWLTPLGIKVNILKGKDLEGMNLLLNVGQASEKESHVVVMEWNGLDESKVDAKDTIAFVGKGVTYDSGGLSLKPSSSMENMKSDMSGAAVVAGVLANAARNKVQKRVIGIVGLVENMVSSNSFRPDDILKSLSGQTVEINNTDAEGRLVLADILHYVQDKYNPSTVIDLATLTGAIVVALGHVYAGLFSNNDDLANSLIESGKEAHEALWRMPMHKAFNDAMDCPIADMTNCAKGSVGAGSSTAAAFLNRFIFKQTKWAHLDIAGVAFLPYEDFASTVGATGFGIRLLNKWLAHQK